VEKMRTRGLYPVYSNNVSFSLHPLVEGDATSPTARNLPSGLKETHVAALTRSLADQDLLPGDSVHSPPVEANGEAATPACCKEADVRLRVSIELCVGVEGP